MTPSNTLALLTSTIAARLPVLLVGAPGVGKTDIVRQAAAECGYDVIVSHPVVSDPTDVKGIPWPDKEANRANFLPVGEFADVLAATRPTVWFIDDIGQAPPAVQAAYMRPLLGDGIPACVTIVAATNRRQDRAGVNGILEPVKSRFATIIELEPCIDDSCNWAIDNDLPVSVIAFWRYRPDLLLDFKSTTDMSNSPSPRTWANLAKLVALNLPASVAMAAYAGAVGEGAAVEFMAFMQLFAALTSVDDILMDPHGSPVPTKPSELYAISTALASRSSAATIGRICIYAERVLAAGHGEFAVLTCRDAERRCPAIKTAPEYIRARCGAIGKMILGESNN